MASSSDVDRNGCLKVLARDRDDSLCANNITRRAWPAFAFYLMHVLRTLLQSLCLQGCLPTLEGWRVGSGIGHQRQRSLLLVQTTYASLTLSKKCVKFTQLLPDGRAEGCCACRVNSSHGIRGFSVDPQLLARRNQLLPCSLSSRWSLDVNPSATSRHTQLIRIIPSLFLAWCVCGYVQEIQEAMLDYQSSSNGFENASKWYSEIGLPMTHADRRR